MGKQNFKKLFLLTNLFCQKNVDNKFNFNEIYYHMKAIYKDQRN